jgi:hypothetical protein
MAGSARPRRISPAGPQAAAPDPRGARPARQRPAPGTARPSWKGDEDTEPPSRTSWPPTRGGAPPAGGPTARSPAPRSSGPSAADFVRLASRCQGGSGAMLESTPAGRVSHLTSPSGLGWPVRHGLGLFLGDLLQGRLPVRLVLLQSPGDCRVLLLSDLRFGLGPLGLCPFGLCLGPCLRASPCGLRRESGLGCLLTIVSWLQPRSIIFACDQEGKDYRSPGSRALRPLGGVHGSGQYGERRYRFRQGKGCGVDW